MLRPVKEIEPLRIATLAAVRERETGWGKLIVGPEVARWFPAGDVRADATVIAVLGDGREDFIAGEKLEPIYLREVSFVKPRPRVSSDTSRSPCPPVNQVALAPEGRSYASPTFVQLRPSKAQGSPVIGRERPAPRNRPFVFNE